MSLVPYGLSHPLRSGIINLSRKGNEKFGTVVKAGVNAKTVTVEVTNYSYPTSPKSHMTKHRRWKRTRSRIHCHDEYEECSIGDKVIIRGCIKISPIKSFYVKQIVLPIGRNAYYAGRFSKDEVDAVGFNEDLREKYKKEMLIL
ncbi:unnamed protein product [Moneuplotes crassus]|uniref:Ribosomal protein S17 n=2 Tax=Euplotes crassus TaxID=5936 RepID=A0AAD2D9N8_EUPCR|nr:unnamed protein product [Moneuplotes crassus]